MKYDYPRNLKRHWPYLVLPPAADAIAYANIGRCACRTMRLAVCNIREDGRRIDSLPEWGEHKEHYRTIQGPTATLRERAKGIPVFTFVRNPYDRLMSFYVRRQVEGYYGTVGIGDRFDASVPARMTVPARMMRAAVKSAVRFVDGPLAALDRRMSGRADGRSPWLDRLAAGLPEPEPDTLQDHFNEFVKKFVAVPFQELDNHSVHQNLFIRDGEGVFVDFTGNLERVGEQWPLIEALAGRTMELPYIVERRPAGFVRPRYTPQTQRLVYEYFRTDFEILGYGYEHDDVAHDLHTDTAGIVVSACRMPPGQTAELRREVEHRNARLRNAVAAGTVRLPLPPDREPAAAAKKNWIKGPLRNGLDKHGRPTSDAYIRAVDVAKDGTVYAGRYNVVYKSADLENLEVVSTFETDKDIVDEQIRALFVDSRGSLFVSYGGEGRIRMSKDGGRSFRPVCDLGFAGAVRGITEDNGGALYAGGYAKIRSARLYRSGDGEHWEMIREWDARHIHDVRVNPFNNWLYVVVGEWAKKMSAESHAVFRSKDGGKSFARVVGATQAEPDAPPRPLFLPINFHGEYVILGTDHFEGDNYIASFRDTGEDRLYDIERMYTLDDPYSAPRVPKKEKQTVFFCFLEWFDGVLLAGARGARRSYLLRSEDAVHWELEETGPKWSYVTASRRRDGDCIVIAKTPTAMVIKKGNGT